MRQVIFPGDSNYSPQKLVQQASQATCAGILEHVFSSSFVSVYIYKLQAQIKLSLIHLYSPNARDEPELHDQGKQFITKMLLHRTVGVKLVKVDDRNEIVGRIYYPEGCIASEVLKNGLAKLSMPKDMNFDARFLKDL